MQTVLDIDRRNMEYGSQSASQDLEALRRDFLAEVLDEVLGSSPEKLEAAGCDLRSLDVLRQTAQVGTAAAHWWVLCPVLPLVEQASQSLRQVQTQSRCSSGLCNNRHMCRR